MSESKSALLTRVELLEQEVASIKAKLATGETSPSVRLEGLWKDIDITDEEIEETKRSVFKEIDDI